ncbi:MAG: hypothetical protein BGO29_12010 [Bacteroidales bacterium 36-12]|nr:MAG: hypothetical protein BGO29_12010 [Bacteroidales bacterium 36-12]
MRRRETESIKDLIQEFLKLRKLDKPLFEKKIVNAWSKVLGENISEYTTDIIVRNRKLYVTLSSSVLRHDLFLSRDEIMQSLNKYVGCDVIDEVVFR